MFSALVYVLFGVWLFRWALRRILPQKQSLGSALDKKQKADLDRYVAAKRGEVDTLVAKAEVLYANMLKRYTLAEQYRKEEQALVITAIRREERAKLALTAALQAIGSAGGDINKVLLAIDEEMKKP